MILLVNCTNPDQMLRGVIVLLTDLQDISLPHNKVSKKTVKANSTLSQQLCSCQCHKIRALIPLPFHLVSSSGQLWLIPLKLYTFPSAVDDMVDFTPAKLLCVSIFIVGFLPLSTPAFNSKYRFVLSLCYAPSCIH